MESGNWSIIVCLIIIPLLFIAVMRPLPRSRHRHVDRLNFETDTTAASGQEIPLTTDDVSSP